MYLKFMKKGNVRIKPGVIPHIFDCKKTSIPLQSVKPTSLIKKKQRQRTIPKIEESKNNMLNVLDNQGKEIGQMEEKTAALQDIQVSK